MHICRSTLLNSAAQMARALYNLEINKLLIHIYAALQLSLCTERKIKIL